MLVNRNNQTAPATRLTVWDLCILGAAVLCALFLLLSPAGEDGQVCIVSWDGGEVTLSLAKPDTLTLESGGFTLTVLVENGGVRVTESGCPDGVCMAVGEIRHGGEIIVCVPADVVIRIPGAGESEGDFVIG